MTFLGWIGGEIQYAAAADRKARSRAVEEQWQNERQDQGETADEQAGQGSGQERRWTGDFGRVIRKTYREALPVMFLSINDIKFERCVFLGYENLCPWTSCGECHMVCGSTSVVRFV